MAATAFCRIPSVSLGFTCLTGDQVTALCEEIVKSSPLNLQSLDLTGLNLEEVHHVILAKAVCKLQCAELSYTDITSEQAATLFQEIIQSSLDLNLETLKLEETRLDLYLFI